MGESGREWEREGERGREREREGERGSTNHNNLKVRLVHILAAKQWHTIRCKKRCSTVIYSVLLRTLWFDFIN